MQFIKRVHCAKITQLEFTHFLIFHSRGIRIIFALQQQTIRFWEKNICFHFIFGAHKISNKIIHDYLVNLITSLNFYLVLIYEFVFFNYSNDNFTLFLNMNTFFCDNGGGVRYTALFTTDWLICSNACTKHHFARCK